MDSSTRVIVNTGAQYVKTAINIVLTLYSTRLVLQVLGVEDFGIYTLLAGVISMLSFATNALATTTQRFLSYHQGKSELEELKNIFANSFYIHLMLGILTLVVLLAIMPLLFNGFLNIPAERDSAARMTYCIVTIILLTTFLTTPYRAVLISHENIVYLTLIDIIDAIFKVGLAIALLYVSFDRLIAYALFLLGVQIFNFIAIAFYALIKYKECIIPSWKRISRRHISSILSFAGWTVYSIGCVIGRTQGIAIVINRIYGSAINAAYGLGFQVSGYVNFASESLLNAIRPQMMRSEGVGDRTRMLWLSEVASKFSFFLLSCFAIPCLFEMNSLLTIWLGTVPEYSVLFCRMVLIACVLDSLTCGLVVANQAIGNIKQYSLVVNTVKLLTLPIAFICLKVGLSLISVAICYVFFEALCAILRIPFVAKTGHLNVSLFIKNVFGRLMIPVGIFLLASFVISNCFIGPYGFLATFFLPNIIYVLAFYFLGMDKSERNYIQMFFKSLKKRIL